MKNSLHSDTVPPQQKDRKHTSTARAQAICVDCLVPGDRCGEQVYPVSEEFGAQPGSTPSSLARWWPKLCGKHARFNIKYMNICSVSCPILQLACTHPPPKRNADLVEILNTNCERFVFLTSVYMQDCNCLSMLSRGGEQYFSICLGGVCSLLIKKYANPGGHSKNLTMHKYADPLKFDSCNNFALPI